MIKRYRCQGHATKGIVRDPAKTRVDEKTEESGVKPISEQIKESAGFKSWPGNKK